MFNVFLDAWIGRLCEYISFLKVSSSSGDFTESLKMGSRRLENRKAKSVILFMSVEISQLQGDKVIYYYCLSDAWTC